MAEKHIKKIGFYTVCEISDRPKRKFKIDSGATIFIAKMNKTISNPYRDVKYFEKLPEAEKYIRNKLKKKTKLKRKVLKKLPKSLYLVLIREKNTNILFVKVGFTTKKYIRRRFSKKYGYEDYELETILRRVNTPNAEKLEDEIKKKLNKKRSVKRYRPILENFSGHTECYDYLGLTEITNIFDSVVKKQLVK